MALLKCRTEPSKFVSVTDPAFAALDAALARNYLETRDFSLIEDKLNESGLAPTVFTVRPLMTQYEHLLGNTSATFVRELVRVHVCDVTNFPCKLENENGNLSLTESSAADIPLEVVTELYQFIQELQSRAGRELDFFTVPDTWRRVRRDIELSMRRAGTRK